MNQAASFSQEQQPFTGTSVLHEGGATACPIPPTPVVGERLSDEAREAAIVMAGKLVEKYMQQRAKHLLDFDITNCFADKGAADASRLKAQEAARLMAELIRGRSPEAAARAQATQGDQQ